MCGDGCSLALWWSFHNTYVYWIVMSIPETNESSATVKSWYKNMYQLWKQKRWGRDQDGRVEECGACLPSMNTSKMHLTCGTILTEYQLKAGRRSPIQPKRQERSLHNRVGRKRKEKRKIRMAPKPLGGSSERGKFPWPQEAPLQQLGAEAWATASRTGERTLAVPGVWSGLSPWVQAGQSKGPPEKHLYAYMKGGAQVCHYTPRRQHVHGPAGFQPPGALRGLVPEGELTSGPIRGTPTAGRLQWTWGPQVGQRWDWCLSWLLGLLRRGWVWGQLQQQQTLWTRTPGGGGCHRVTPPGGQLKELRKTVGRNADDCNKELETRKRKQSKLDNSVAKKKLR